MSHKFQSKEFKALKRKWYDKLKKSDFNDIEQEDGNLKQWAVSDFTVRRDPKLFNSKEKYFQLAGQFAHDYKFSNKRDQFIWVHHAEGLTIMAIVAKLKSRNFKSANRSSTHDTIQRLEKEMLSLYAKEDD